MTRMIYSFLKIKYENSNRNGLFCNRKILHPYLNKSFFSCEQILQSMNVCETERRQLRVMPSIKNILIGGYLLKVITTLILANYEQIYDFHKSSECGGLILCRLQDSNVQVLWVRF